MFNLVEIHKNFKMLSTLLFFLFKSLDNIINLDKVTRLGWVQWYGKHLQDIHGWYFKKKSCRKRLLNLIHLIFRQNESFTIWAKIILISSFRKHGINVTFSLISNYRDDYLERFPSTFIQITLALNFFKSY